MVVEKKTSKKATPVSSPFGLRNADHSKKRRHRDHQAKDIQGISKQAIKKDSHRSKSVSPESLRSPLDVKSSPKAHTRNKGSHSKVPSRESPGKGPSSPLAPSLRASPFTQTAVVILGAAFLWRIERSHRNADALKSSTCSTHFCKKYGSLLNSAVNDGVDPCNNFYEHVCGLWENTHGDRTVMEEAWRGFIMLAMTKLSEEKDPAATTDIESKARLYLHTCMKVVNQSNIPNVKQALARGNITWPEKNPQPDFLRALLFMSRTLAMPVLLHFIYPPEDGLLIWKQRSDYMRRAKNLRRLEHANHIREFLSTAYEDFSGAANDTRLDEILDRMSIFLDFDNKMANSDLTPVTFNDSTKFFEFTPSVSKERWRAILNRYIKRPVESYAGVTIHGVDYFKALFEVHKTHDEDVMNDIVEALAVTTLVPFTSMRMITSFHIGHGEMSATSLMETCFSLFYPIFGYVVNHLFLYNLETTKEHARELAESLRATFINSTIDPSQNLVVSNTSSSKSKHTLDIVFGILDRSAPSQFPVTYKDYPSITEDPLQNWVNIAHYYSGKTTENAIVKYEESDHMTFTNFVMMLHYLMFPIAGEGAHIGVLTGGIGLRFAATVFYQLVEEAGDAAAVQIYERNHQCLGLEGGQLDIDLQGAIAAVPITQKLYAKKREDYSSKKPLGGIQSFTEEQVPFAASCFLLCGEKKGARSVQHTAYAQHRLFEGIQLS
ncbi:hypothetical protein MRX96_021216 [Rhipicephalus microplus]